MDFDEHPGVPQRPPAYAHLLIDSRDRGLDPAGLLLPNANNFVLSAKGNAALLYGYFTRAAITQISFDWYFPLILAGYNDTIRVTNVTTATTANVTFGANVPYQDYVQLAADLQVALIASPVGNPALTVTWEAASSSMVIQTNNGSSLEFVSPLVADPSKGALFKLLTKTYRTIGVNNFQIANALSDIILSVPRASTSYVDILSERLTKYQRVKDFDTDQDQPRSTQIARLYLTPPGQRVVIDPAGTSGPGTAPFTICVDYNTPKQIKWSPREALYQLDLQVRDMDGDLLPWDGLDATWEYQLTLVCSET